MMRARGCNTLSRSWAGDERGAAAAEFALWAAVLIPIVASATDLGFYVFQRMQVKQAAQMAAQTVWQTCSSAANPGNLPAAQTCVSTQNLVAKMTAAAQSTGLGSNVSLGTSHEDFDCVDDSGALTNVGTQDGVIPVSGSATAPKVNVTTCASASVSGSSFTGNNAAPGDYVTVSVTYTYTPLFGGASIAALLNPSITETAWTRLN
jgi:Flp pilus assembly protein TadG